MKLRFIFLLIVVFSLSLNVVEAQQTKESELDLEQTIELITAKLVYRSIQESDVNGSTGFFENKCSCTKKDDNGRTTVVHSKELNYELIKNSITEKEEFTSTLLEELRVLKDWGLENKEKNDKFQRIINKKDSTEEGFSKLIEFINKSDRQVPESFENLTKEIVGLVESCKSGSEDPKEPELSSSETAEEGQSNKQDSASQEESWFTFQIDVISILLIIGLFVLLQSRIAQIKMDNKKNRSTKVKTDWDNELLDATNRKVKNMEKSVSALKEEINALKSKQSVPAPKEEKSPEIPLTIDKPQAKEIFYMASPDDDGNFKAEYVHSIRKETSIYEFEKTSDTTAVFKITNPEKALETPHKYIEPCCDPLNSFNDNCSSITTNNQGTVELKNGLWTTIVKAKITYS